MPSTFIRTPESVGRTTAQPGGFSNAFSMYSRAEGEDLVSPEDQGADGAVGGGGPVSINVAAATKTRKGGAASGTTGLTSVGTTTQQNNRRVRDVGNANLGQMSAKDLLHQKRGRKQQLAAGAGASTSSLGGAGGSQNKSAKKLTDTVDMRGPPSTVVVKSNDPENVNGSGSSRSSEGGRTTMATASRSTKAAWSTKDGSEQLTAAAGSARPPSQAGESRGTKERGT
eukprot:g429.t1